MTEVNVPAILKASGYMDLAGLTVARAQRNLNTQLEAIGAAWGDDDTGAEWAGPYVPGKDAVLKGLLEIAKGLGQLSLQLQNMAALYGSVEDANLQ